MTSDKILVLDCGGKQAYYTCEKLRCENFYCELIDMNTPVDAILSANAKGLVLIGEDACPNDLTKLGLPLLALGGAARSLAESAGATHTGVEIRDRAAFVQYRAIDLFESVREGDHFFTRAEGYTLPEPWQVLADTAEGLTIAFGIPSEHIYAYAGYVENNDPDGLQILQNFAGNICGCAPMSSIPVIAGEIIERLKEDIPSGKVVLPVFVNTESAVAAALLQKAVGNRLVCMLIDTGLLRTGDMDLMRHCYVNEMGITLVEYDASERFLKALRGVTDPAEKRAMIHREYNAVFTEQYLKLTGVEHLADGFTYSDVLKHKERNVSVMLEGSKKVEPLRHMFRDEVRALGAHLSIPAGLASLPPFFPTGLSVRCLGEVTPDRLDLLRRAEAIYREEIENAGFARRVAQAFVILTDFRTHGEHGMGYVCVLRALGSSTAGRAAACRLPYDLMENAVLRITNEVRGISRVVYDITGRPTADLEWE